MTEILVGEGQEQLDMEYLRVHLARAPLTPYPWVGEDENIMAFGDKGRLVEWYGQPPGVDGEPYRDRGFYTRELAMLSRVVRPITVAEFGTSLGIGTCLLRWLNPWASLITVDINTMTYMPGDLRVPIGVLAREQDLVCSYVTRNSWDYDVEGCIDLCFIDADHSYESVAKDSRRAWSNRCQGNRWAIAWHDHNSRHPGVMQAVAEFCRDVGITLQSRPDSDTVWIMGEP